MNINAGKYSTIALTGVYRDLSLLYRGRSSPVVRPGDILPCALRDHWLNSEGVPWLHHPNGLVLCRPAVVHGGGVQCKGIGDHEYHTWNVC